LSRNPVSYIKNRVKRYLLKKEIDAVRRRKRPLNIIIGAADTKYKGWISTDLPVFDALNKADWSMMFSKGSINRILAEHVIDYWKKEEFHYFLKTASYFLSEAAYIRIAVPDMFNPQPDYISYITSGVDLNGLPDRKEVFYDYIRITDILSVEKYDFRLLEYFDEEGNFNSYMWKEEDGFVRRSFRYDSRNKIIPFSYTSLIVDAWPKKYRI
jgi:predicted SAM-dependent methyltransferase